MRIIPHSVNKTLTPKRRPRPVVENDDYAAFSRRVIRAQARRIGTGDVEGLRDLLALEHELHHAIHTAVTGLRTNGYSWAEIATRDRHHPTNRPNNAGPAHHRLKGHHHHDQ